MYFWARLFESRLTLTWDLSLTKAPVSLISSYSKEFSQQFPSGGLKATKVKMFGKNYLQESKSFDCKISEFKIVANPSFFLTLR